MGAFALIHAPAMAQVEWVTSLNTPGVSSSYAVQSDCLMPRLGASSPILTPRPPASAPQMPAASHWWARTQDSEWASWGVRWTRFDPDGGAITGRAPWPTGECGTPITADGGRIVANVNTSNRLSKFDPTGSLVWQTSSNLSPANYSGLPVISVASTGDISFMVGSLLARANAAGNLLFQTETNRDYPRYLAVDSAGNTWIVSGYASSGPVYVIKVSATGTLLWSTAIDSPCSDSASSALLTSDDEMLVAIQSCNEGRLSKINASGQIQWQRLVSSPPGQPYVQLTSLAVDSASNVFVGGCASGNYSSGPNARTLVASWSASGAERWTAWADLLNSNLACVVTLSLDASGNLFAASSSNDGTGSPALWALSTTGVEQWRHRGVLANPTATNIALALDSDGKLIVLGDARVGNGGRAANVRRINVATLGSPLRLRILDVPVTAVGYREPFSVRIGLRTTADVAANAAADLVVNLGLAAGMGRLGGGLSCVIMTGTSECTMTEVRYDVVESGVIVIANADGFAAAQSPSITFRKANTATILEALTAAPYTAFSVVRVRAGVQGPPPAPGHGISGYLNGPNSATYPGIENCDNPYTPDSLPTVECDLLVRTAAMPLNAQFVAYGGDNRYNSSSMASLSLAVTKVMPALQITNDPANTYVGGDRIRFRVSIMTAGGFNATRFVPANAVTITGGSCGNLVSAGNLSNQYAGSYLLCEVGQVPTGALSVTFGFAGSDDLLSATAVQHAVTIHTGGVIRGSANTGIPITACSTAPGVVCSVSDTYPSEWQCVGPDPMSGQVFWVPTPPTANYYFTNAPFRFSNFTGVYRYPNYLDWRYQSGACKADVDGDGAALALTDGVLILRRMLGLSGDALIESATHVCVPLSPAGIAATISIAAYDLDGDGQVRAETDGLLLLRAMLGFREAALVNGAVGASATRRTGAEIASYLNYNCSFNLSQ